MPAESSSSSVWRGSADRHVAPVTGTVVQSPVPLRRRVGTWSSIAAAMLVAQTAVASPLNRIGIGANNATVVLLALCSVFAFVPIVRGRAFLRQQISFLIGILLFTVWAALRVTPESFVFYGPFSIEPTFNSGSLTKAAFLTLATCALLASVRDYDRGVFLWSFGILSLGGGLISEDLNGIWVARSFAFAGLAFMLAPGRRWVRVPLVAGSLALLVSEPFQGPWLALLAGAVVWVVSAMRGIARIAVVGILLGSALLLIEFSSLVFSALDYDNNASARLVLWAEYLSGVPARLLFGHGFGTTPMAIADYSHNSLIDIVFGLGLVGVGLWLWLFVIFARDSVKSRLAPLWVAALVMSLFSGYFSANSTYWLIGGLAVSMAARSRGEPSQAHLLRSGLRQGPTWT